MSVVLLGLTLLLLRCCRGCRGCRTCCCCGCSTIGLIVVVGVVVVVWVTCVRADIHYVVRGRSVKRGRRGQASNKGRRRLVTYRGVRLEVYVCVGRQSECQTMHTNDIVHVRRTRKGRHGSSFSSYHLSDESPPVGCDAPQGAIQSDLHHATGITIGYYTSCVITPIHLESALAHSAGSSSCVVGDSGSTTTTTITPSAVVADDGSFQCNLEHLGEDVARDMYVVHFLVVTRSAGAIHAIPSHRRIAYIERCLAQRRHCAVRLQDDRFSSYPVDTTLIRLRRLQSFGLQHFDRVSKCRDVSVHQVV